MTANDLPCDLEWWRANRHTPAADAATPDDATVRDLLARLRAWKVQHDQDRAQQPGPFLKMAWDGVFGDEDERVAEAIRQIEDALATPRD